MYFLSTRSFCCNALGSPARWSSAWNSSDRQQKQASSVHYLWQECALYKNSGSQTVQMQSVKSEPLVLFSWIRSVWFVCLVSLVTRLQYVRGSLFFLTCSVKKEKGRNLDFCISSSCTLHLQQFISFGICLQIRKETSGHKFLFCQITSVQFIQIHFFSFLVSVHLSLVWFGWVCFGWVQAPAA